VVIATGVNAGGNREVFGAAVGDNETEAFWKEFLRSLRTQGPAGVELVISDIHAGLVAATIRTIFAQPQAATVHSQLHLVADLLAAQFPPVKDMLIAAENGITAYASLPSRPLDQDRVRQPAGTPQPRGQTPRRCRPSLPQPSAGPPSGAVLAELHAEWQVADRRYLSEASMAELLGTGTTTVINGPTALLRGKKTA
jgi:hypothetical protein